MHYKTLLHIWFECSQILSKLQNLDSNKFYIQNSWLRTYPTNKPHITIVKLTTMSDGN